MDRSNARLLVVILNYRSADLTIGCLRSLAPEIAGLPPVEVVVTDNASGDGSVERIASVIEAEGMSSWAHVVPLPRNGGYAYGNNAYVRDALHRASPPDYVHFLNPDTVVRPGAVRALLDFMEAHPTVGIAGSRLEDPDGTPQCSAFNFPTAYSELDRGLQLGIVSRLLADKVVHQPVPDFPCRVDWVAGASMMVRREVFVRSGLMDEVYFLYFEEVDFLLNASRAGFPTWYVPESRVVHYVGQTTGVTDTKKAPSRLPAYWFDSRRRYFVKNFGAGHAMAADLAWITGFALRSVRQLIERREGTDPPHVFEDFVDHSVFHRGFAQDPSHTR